MNPDESLISVRLECPCPPNCLCGETVSKSWSHNRCKQPSFITQKGDIFCNSKGCSSYFIRDARFQCKSNNQTWSEFRSVTEFAMALAMAMKSASQFNLSDNDLIEFITSINQEALKRWNL